jgi:hypothetical protein
MVMLVFIVWLGAATAPAAWASPIVTEFDKSLFYMFGDSFQGGSIDGGTLEDSSGFGMGFIVPLSPQSNFGIQFSSPDYDNIYGEIQWSLSRNPDVLRFTYNQYGHDGSIARFGLYRDFPANSSLASALGTGVSVFHVKHADQNAYLSLFVEAQARYMLNQDSFFYVRGSYDYHLSSVECEAGVEITI